MASFLENILHSNIGKQVLNMAGEKLQDGSLQEIFGKIGGENSNIGEIAAGVINVIGLATGSLNQTQTEE